MSVQNSQIKNILTSNKLRLAISNKCNLSCGYCHNEGQPHNEQERFISMDYIQTMVKWFCDNNVYVKSVNVTGGEPLLHSELISIIKEINRITDDIHINTNGVLLTKALIDTFLELNSIVMFGVDDISSGQTKPFVEPTTVSIEHIRSMIKYAARKSKVHINTVFSKFNYGKLDNLIDTFMDMGLESVKIIRLNDFDPRGLNEDAAVSEELKTNQMERDYFFDFRQKYIEKAWHYEVHPYLGRISVFLRKNDNTEFKILFCDDVCSSGACANMFTEIDALGNLMVCPKHHITSPIDFGGDFDSVCETISDGRNRMCDSFSNRYDLRGDQS